MDEIDELERRIAAALDRIARGIEGRPAQVPAAESGEAPAEGDLFAPPSANALRDALELERRARASLQERLAALQADHAALAEDFARLREKHAAQGETLAALRTERAAEIEDLTGLVAALTPLVEEASHA